MSYYWKYILLLLIVGMSCSDPDSPGPDIPDVPQDTIATPVLYALQKTYMLPSEAVVLNVALKSDAAVAASLLQEYGWLSVIDTRTVENHEVLVSVKRNDTEFPRTAFLLLKDIDGLITDTVTITQLITPEVHLEQYEFFVKYGCKELIVPVHSNVELEVVITEGSDWISFSGTKETDQMVFHLVPNETESIREGVISFKYGETILSQKIKVKQMHPSEDGRVVTLQKATEGVGINLVILGDGYTTAEIENGKFDRNFIEGYESFFDIEPYRSFRNYFNVYAVYAHSERSGGWDKQQEAESHTKFSVAYEGYRVNLECDPEACFEYASKALVGERNTYTILLLSNMDRDAGTAYLFQRGAGIAICPVSRAEAPRDLKHLVKHELGGHAFGKLADEYVLSGMSIPDWEINGLRNAWWPNGIYLNISLTNDPEEVAWKDFIGHPLYPETGIFSGAYTYAEKVWRSSDKSIMNRDMNEAYYNAYSRYLIVKRILEHYNNKLLSVEEFIATDQGRIMETNRRKKFEVPRGYVGDPSPSPVLIRE